MRIRYDTDHTRCHSERVAGYWYRLGKVITNITSSIPLGQNRQRHSLQSTTINRSHPYIAQTTSYRSTIILTRYFLTWCSPTILCLTQLVVAFLIFRHVLKPQTFIRLHAVSLQAETENLHNLDHTHIDCIHSSPI